MFTLQEIDSIVEKGILTLNLKGEPNELYDPIEYIISIGGKRIRPKMSLMTYNLFSDKIDNSILFPALAMEIFHGFTLIHDDIMDDAPLRRSQITVHKRWNNNIAILSGDVMCIKSYQYISQCPPQYLKKLLAIFSRTAAQVCEGQQIDMNFEAAPYITLDDYIDMIGLKTAVLIACSAKLGAIIAGADDKTADSLYNYGYQLGLAFQIKDDYLDSYGNTQTFGKAIGGDILCNKKTWLMVETIKRADIIEKKELDSIFKDGSLEPKEKISKVLAIYNKLGVKEAAENAVIEYHRKANLSAMETSLTEQQKQQLLSFADSLINRNK
ncbi:MAG: polyprenyl synthetase family protein [Bacteroidales bacterium]|jgi:geranylgeranyl diphosphate synthase type II